MKFLLMGDRHLTPNAPLARIDNFEETCRNKDNEILKIARDNNVEAILEAGDFFEEGRSRLSNEFIQQTKTRWFGTTSISEIIAKKATLPDKEFLEYINSITNIKMIGVAGNHDLIGGAPESLINTTLGLFKSLGYIELPTKDKPIIFTDPLTKKTIAITATSYHPLMDTEGHLDDYIITEKLGDFHIHIVHGMLTDKSLGPIRNQTLIDQIKDTKADVTLCGHIHTGFQTVEYNGKYFVNPGSVIRQTASKAEMNRQVHVTLLEITDKIALTDIPLKSARPANEVLTRDHILKNKERKSLVELYDEAVSSYDILKDVNIHTVMESVMDKEGLSDELKKVYHEKINEKDSSKRALLKREESKEGTWIKRVEIINFQSHAHQVLNFDQHMNLLVGESDNGKSSVLRAIYWVYTGKPSGTSVIRHGEDRCSVTLYLANGTAINHTIEVNPKDRAKNAKNEYTITTSTGEKITGNSRSLKEIQEKYLQYVPFVVEDDKTVDINFMRQGEGWFLIGDEISSPQRAKIIGAIMGTNNVDACMSDCSAELKSIGTKITATEKDIVMLLEQEQAYADLPEQKTQIENLEELVVHMDEIQKKIEAIRTLQFSIKEHKNSINTLTELIDGLNVQDYNGAFEAVKSKQALLLQVQGTVEAINNSKKTISEADATIQGLASVNIASNALNKLRNLSEQIASVKSANEQRCQSAQIVETATQLINSIGNMESVIAEIKTAMYISDNIEKITQAAQTIAERQKLARNAQIIINSCSKLDDARLALTECDKKIKTIDDISRINSEIEERKKTVKSCAYEATKQASIKKFAEDKLEKMLNELGVCPTCGQEIAKGGHYHD